MADDKEKPSDSEKSKKSLSQRFKEKIAEIKEKHRLREIVKLHSKRDEALSLLKSLDREYRKSGLSDNQKKNLETKMGQTVKKLTKLNSDLNKAYSGQFSNAKLSKAIEDKKLNLIVERNLLVEKVNNLLKQRTKNDAKKAKPEPPLDLSNQMMPKGPIDDTLRDVLGVTDRDKKQMESMDKLRKELQSAKPETLKDLSNVSFKHKASNKIRKESGATKRDKEERESMKNFDAISDSVLKDFQSNNNNPKNPIEKNPGKEKLAAGNNQNDKTNKIGNPNQDKTTPPVSLENIPKSVQELGKNNPSNTPNNQKPADLAPKKPFKLSLEKTSKNAHTTYFTSTGEFIKPKKDVSKQTTNTLQDATKTAKTETAKSDKSTRNTGSQSQATPDQASKKPFKLSLEKTSKNANTTIVSPTGKVQSVNAQKKASKQKNKTDKDPKKTKTHPPVKPRPDNTIKTFKR